MKESTGELSMVVITLLAIALIAGIVTFLVPMASDYINDELLCLVLFLRLLYYLFLF